MFVPRTLTTVLLCLLCAFSNGNSQTKLHVNGYLSQAYGQSNSYQLHGIGNDGTADYRNLALRFRYSTQGNNNLTIQFSNRSLGASPLMEHIEEVELDWGYYEHFLGDNTWFRVGKVKIPFGIYNEIRDVGVLLPFFQLPNSFYGEGRSAPEGLSGLTFTHAFYILNSWRIEMVAFGGYASFIDWLTVPSIDDGSVQFMSGMARMRRNLGGLIWIETPIDGLRANFGYGRRYVEGGVNFTENLYGEQWGTNANASLDASFENWFLRSEFSYGRLEETGVWTYGIYVQSGWWMSEHVGLNLQFDKLKIKDVFVPVSFTNGVVLQYDLDADTEAALSLVYRASSNLVIKAEAHRYWGTNIEDRYVSFFEDPVWISYGLLSVSASF